MYVTSQPYKCIKCGCAFQFSPHDSHSAPVSSAGIPVCPVCWDDFIITIGLGYCTTRLGGPSEYENVTGRNEGEARACNKKPLTPEQIEAMREEALNRTLEEGE